jgi:hypothetical protein
MPTFTISFYTVSQEKQLFVFETLRVAKDVPEVKIPMAPELCACHQIERTVLKKLIGMSFE